jgi:hypothetical protein
MCNPILGREQEWLGGWVVYPLLWRNRPLGKHIEAIAVPPRSSKNPRDYGELLRAGCAMQEGLRVGQFVMGPASLSARFPGGWRAPW